MNELLLLALAMLAAGGVAGLLAGLFGIGGGVVVVPIMELALAFFGVDAAIRMHIAVATSLAIIIPTSVSSTRAHHAHGAVDFELVKRWAFLVLVGSIAGTFVADSVHGRVLSGVFAVFAFAVALKLIFQDGNKAVTTAVPRNAAVLAIPFAIGVLSSMLGIGGGTISVMVMTMFGLPIHRAVGTAALFGLVISLPGTLSYVYLGFGDARLPPYSIGYISLVGFALVAPMTVMAAPLGARLAHGLSQKALRLAFGAFLLAAAARMFYQYVSP
ncbi:MAG: sulfite exporter TauE/SafE family protein [Gammaproteobacteria bacterium]|nr:sulfite exporter TauE/SafE family protein [Gammaproteobacteria bacterium]